MFLFLNFVFPSVSGIRFVLARDRQDVTGSRCVKNTDGELNVTTSERLVAWKQYAEQLLNSENTWTNTLVSDVNEGPVRLVDVSEVRRAAQEIKKRKAPGPSGMPIEVIEICGCEDKLNDGWYEHA